MILVLCIFTGFIVLSGLIENHNLYKIHRDFSSMYADRLIPAAEIYFMSEQLYQRQLLLEALDADPQSNERILQTLRTEDNTIDSLLTAYEKTYLVHDESVYLDQFKQNLDNYMASKDRFLSMIHGQSLDEALDLFEKETRILFETVIADLQLLAKIQPSVGEELINSSNADFASNNLLFYLRFSLTILISLFILLLIRTSGLTNQPQQKFHLN